MKKILVVVDMQNDFIDGALGTKEAVAIVDKVVKKIEDSNENFEKEFNQKNYSVNFNENYPLEHNEIMISVAAYNELFDAE